LYGAYRSDVSGRQIFRKDVDFSVRETFESALVLGRKALETLGIDPLRARMVQEPLREPEREAKALNPEAEAIIESDAARGAAQ
jgi:hypothetical protein